MHVFPILGKEKKVIHFLMIELQSSFTQQNHNLF